MQNFKKYILLLLLLELFFSYAPAYAQTVPGAPTTPAINTPQYGSRGTSPQATITKYLCTPDIKSPTGATGNPLFLCINQIYKFAIVVASVMGVFFIVIAGYLYISSDGNNESVEKAKGMLVSTITALVILLVGYVLLKAINPDLIQFQTIQPPNVPAVAAPAATTGTTGATGTAGANSLQTAGINVNSLPTAGLQPGIINELVSLKQACGANCNVTLTSTTGGAHSSGICSHGGGYKVDLSPDAGLSNYIISNFKNPPPSIRSDGATVYTSPTGGTYADERSKPSKCGVKTGTCDWTGSHWDVASC